MKFLLFSALIINSPVNQVPAAVSQSWQEFPTEQACVTARDVITTGERITDQGLKRIAITTPPGYSQSTRREGTCIPAE